ncbi:hypothetical protein MRB53_026746 [Persea americana]|uniref:Uncharacterized protein n=1 Tax=Persea americana TaxID=3435 RepID=A0ACC2LJH3_PERAE|nr:hypothetical protein MRB53_026746 [Persea americana]
MGKRKSRAKPPPKKKLKLDKCFTCPFCNHPGTVTCKMYKELMTSEAFCYICEESYSTTIHGLSEPIDVYSEWIDECERVNNFEV